MDRSPASKSTKLSDRGLGSFMAFEGARSGLVNEQDLAEASGLMDPGTVAVLIVYENRWARPFVGAALDVEAQVISSARIPATAVMETLDALDAPTPAS